LLGPEFNITSMRPIPLPSYNSIQTNIYKNCIHYLSFCQQYRRRTRCEHRVRYRSKRRKIVIIINAYKHRRIYKYIQSICYVTGSVPNSFELSVFLAQRPKTRYTHHITKDIYTQYASTWAYPKTSPPLLNAM